MQHWRCSLPAPQLPQRLGQCSIHTSLFRSKRANARRAALWGAAGVVAMAGAEQTVTEPVSGHGVVLTSVCCHPGQHCHLRCHLKCRIPLIVALPLLHRSTSLVFTLSFQLLSWTGTSALGLCRVQATGVQFPLVARFWEGDTPFRCMGAGVRSKKFGFIGVKVRLLVIQRSHLASLVGLPASDRPEGTTVSVWIAKQLVTA